MNKENSVFDQDASDIIINPRASDLARSVVTDPRADALARLRHGRKRTHSEVPLTSSMPLEKREALTAEANTNSVYSLRRAGAIAMVAATGVLTAGTAVTDVSTDIVKSGREAFIDFINPGMDTTSSLSSGHDTPTSDIQSQSK